MTYKEAFKNIGSGILGLILITINHIINGVKKHKLTTMAIVIVLLVISNLFTVVSCKETYERQGVMCDSLLDSLNYYRNIIVRK